MYDPWGIRRSLGNCWIRYASSFPCATFCISQIFPANGKGYPGLLFAAQIAPFRTLLTELHDQFRDFKDFQYHELIERGKHSHSHQTPTFEEIRPFRKKKTVHALSHFSNESGSNVRSNYWSNYLFKDPRFPRGRLWEIGDSLSWLTGQEKASFAINLRKHSTIMLSRQWTRFESTMGCFVWIGYILIKWV